MNLPNCVRCGKETGEEEMFCPECQAVSGDRKSKRLWVFSMVFSAILLSLTGLLLWHGGLSFGGLSLDSIWGKPAAVINGESISRADLVARLRKIQTIVERQHGRDIFAGERGRGLWANLENEVLQGMVEEKLVSQEARKLGIQVTKEQVSQKVDRITKEIFGPGENFQARLQEDGMSKEDLQDHIRYLLLAEALKKAKAQEGTNPDLSFNAWLIQAKQNAEVAFYDSEKWSREASLSAGGCCSSKASSGVGRCGGQTATPQAADPKTEREAQRAALEAFQKTNPAEKRVTAEVMDYGCHMQVDIQKEGRVIKSYSYQNGKVEEES
jgi:hypothetical protein